MVCYPVCKGGQLALTAIATHMEVYTGSGHPRSCVGVLFGPLGVDELQAVVLRACVVQQVYQGLAPPSLVRGSLFSPAVVEVLFGAQTLPHRHWPRVIIFQEGVMPPVLPVPGRSVRHRKAAFVPCGSLAVLSVTALAGGNWGWKWAALGHSMGF